MSGQDVYIEKAGVDTHGELIRIWESSVRKTHTFVAESDLNELKPLILDQYFNMIDLWIARKSEDTIAGFFGVNDGNLEMLFIDPRFQGRGIGRCAVLYAIDNLGVTNVDVNEQNEQALGFYRHQGFEVIGRSPLDAEDKPYPILHMRLKE